MHTSYLNRLGHRADFRVNYRFYTGGEGGRNTLPVQGYRADFWYEHPAHSGTNQLFMIWPEFEDENGGLLLNDELPVPRSGTARMWIIFPEMRMYHKDKIHAGLIGYFMEGSRRVAVCEVMEIIDLQVNPTTAKE